MTESICATCGQHMLIDEFGISHHLNDDCEIDYGTDSDHVALDENLMAAIT